MTGLLRGLWNRTEPAMLGSVLAVAVCGWLFLELADEVKEGETRALDEQMVMLFRQPGRPETPVGPPWFPEMVRDATALGGLFVLGLATAIIAGYFLLLKKRRVVLLVVATTACSMGLSLLLKGLFARPRPDLVPHLSEVSTSSFPSGHAMMAAAVYLTLAVICAEFTSSLRLKAYLLAAALGVTVVVGLSRVYLGVHYPSDVLAGWSLGTAWAIAAWFLARRVRRSAA